MNKKSDLTTSSSKKTTSSKIKAKAFPDLKKEQMPSLVFKGSKSVLSTCFFNGNKWEQSMEIKNQVGAIDPVSNYSPNLVEFENQLFMVYKGKSSDILYYATFNGTSWSNETKITIAESNYTPSLAVYNGKLFMIYKGKSSDTLYYASFDKYGWSNGTKITIAESNYTPALAVYDKQLFMVYKGKSSDTLYYASFNGTNWSDGTKIKNAESNRAPAIVAYNNLLYMVYKAKKSEDLYYSSFNGSDWYHYPQIPAIESKETPSLAVYKDNLFMVHKGKSSDTLYHSTFDGVSWKSQKKIGLIESDCTPGLVVSSIALRPDLAAGWDLVFAMKTSGIQEEVTRLFKNKTLPNRIKNKNVNLAFTAPPQLMGGIEGSPGLLQLHIPVDGEVKLPKYPAPVQITGTVALIANLQHLKQAISKKSKGSYILSTDLSTGNLFESIDLSELSISGDSTIPGALDQLLLSAMNSALVTIKKPLQFKFHAGFPIPLDNLYKETVVINKGIATLFSLTGKENKGSNNLSPNILSDSRDSTCSIILSNKVIMGVIASAAYVTLQENDIFLTNDFLGFKKDVYPLYLENTEDSKEDKHPCGIKIKIDEGGLHSTFIKTGGKFKLEFALGIRYKDVIAWHTFPVQVFIAFSSLDDKLKLGFTYETGSCNGGLTCNKIKPIVKEAIAEFSKLFSDGLIFSIPNFDVKNVLAPSYIRLSGKLKA